jgi:hypothetical protein
MTAATDVPLFLKAVLGAPANIITASSSSPGSVGETCAPEKENTFFKSLIEKFNRILDEIGIFFKEFKNKSTDPIARTKFAQVLIVIVCILLYAIMLLMALILYIRIQWELRQRNNKDAAGFKRESVRPYKDTLEYKVLNASIFSKYPYKLMFYLSAVGISILIVSLLMGMEAKVAGAAPAAAAGTPKPEEAWYQKWSFRFLLIFAVLFIGLFYTVEVKFYNKIAEYNTKIKDLNATIRAIIPANLAFLKAIGKPPEVGQAVEYVLRPALLSLNTNVGEVARGICILNLYHYYYDFYKSSQYDMQNVFSCFNPINKLLPSSNNCFSDYMINNNSYIPNKVDVFLNYLKDTEAESSPLVSFVNNNRSKLMLEINKYMNDINRRSSCLGSAYAFNLFLKMARSVLLIVWLPAIFIIILLIFFREKCAPPK